MVKKADLATVVRNAGGGTRRRASQESTQNSTDTGEQHIYQQPSRKRTKPITVHLPIEVRDQLKIIAIQQNKTLQNLISESFNDLFAKYGKPEIAPK